MKRRRVAPAFGAVALVAIVLPTRSANAGDVELFGERMRYDVTESLLAEDHASIPCIRDGQIAMCDSGDKATAYYQDMFERLDVDLAGGHWLAGLRLDGAGFLNAPVNHDAGFENVFAHRYQDDLRVEKFYATYTSRHLELTLGDSYVQFGNGLALSLRKLDELGQDSTLRGIKAVIHQGPLDVTTVAGFTNTTNVEQITDHYAPDPNDFIYGIRGEARVLGAIVGLHGVGSMMRINPGGVPCTSGDYAPIELGPDPSVNSDSCDRVYTTGATFEIPMTSFGLHLSAEADLRYAVRPGDDLFHDAQRAEAFYATATETRGNLTALVEYKDYRNLDPFIYSSSDLSLETELQVPYFATPTAERPLAEVLDEIDVRGPHVRFDYSLGPSALVYLSGAYFVDGFEGTSPKHGAEHQIFDPYAGTQFFWSDGESHAFLSGGDRYDRFAEDNTQFNQDLHLEYDVVQVVKLPWSIGLEGDHHERSQLTADTNLQRWTEGDISLLLEHSPDWIVSAGYEYTTQGLAISSFELETASYPVKSLPNATITWNPSPRSSILLFLGGSRGGLRCYNVCKVYPPFLGGKLSAVFRL